MPWPRTVNRLAIALLMVGVTALGGNAAEQAALKVLSTAEQASDIAAFRSGFMDLDRAYSPKARAEAERRLSDLAKANRPMPVAEFLVTLCRITALADNGHSGCFYPRPPVVTVTFVSIGGEFYVLAAGPENADLLGAQLLSIDGRSMSSIRPAVRSLFGGVPAKRDLRAADTLSRPELLQALGVTAASDSATYRLRDSAGRVIERHLTPSRSGPTWARLPRSDQTPWSLQNSEMPFRWRCPPRRSQAP